MPPGSRLVFPPTQVTARPAALVTFGPAAEDAAGEPLRLTVRFRPAGASGAGISESELFSETLPPPGSGPSWVERRFRPALPPETTGSFIVECAPVPGKRSPGELALYEFVASDEASIDLDRARAFRQWRMRNEKANFDAYYKHALFQETQAVASTSASATLVERLKGSWSRLTGGRPAASPEAPASRAAAPAPAPPASAFTYAHNLLLERLALRPPAFGLRLSARVAARASGAPVRILSLCSGEARIEAGLVRHLPASSLRLTLLDMNPGLLERAKEKLSRSCAVEGVLADVNELDLRGRKFDVILCVSGLHHVVELEHVFEEISGALEDDGEFWSIGETLGRNGGRMWPESYEVANDFFRRLPPKYRVNRTTGNVVDENLGDMDHSIGCFEGIRCESIEPVLARSLAPVDVCRHNCTLWKLFSPTYSDNYDTASADDRGLIDEAVNREIALYQNGGRPVELNGVYRRRN